MIALAAMLVLAVCGAMRAPALSGVASHSVRCVTTFGCGHSGPGSAEPVNADPASASGSPAGSSSSARTDAIEQPQEAATTQRQLPGTPAAAAGARGLFPYPFFRPNPIGPPTLPWTPIGHPRPPRIVWCEINVGCGSSRLDPIASSK